MPSINLPTINIPEEGLKSKETMENILDTLLKYRKELNFLLMNLDEENMPTIENRIIDAEGNISEVTQTAEEIKLFVGNMDGDMAQLIINAGGITSYVTNTQGEVTIISQNVDDISLFVGNMTGSYANMIIDAGGITSFVTDGNELATIINQTNNTVSILANKIELTGITTIYDEIDKDNYIQFDNGSMDMYYNGLRYLYIDVGSIVGAEIGTYNDEPIKTYSPLSLNGGLDCYDISTFHSSAYFNGRADFTGATSIRGLIVKDLDGYKIGTVELV